MWFPPTDLLHASVHLISEEDIQLVEEGLTVCLVLCLGTRQELLSHYLYHCLLWGRREGVGGGGGGGRGERRSSIKTVIIEQSAARLHLLQTHTFSCSLKAWYFPEELR